MDADESSQADPLFQGLTRAATVKGVPMIPLLGMLGGVGFVALWTSPLAWLLAPPAFFVMRLITKSDDKAFRIWGLWYETKGRNKFKGFWGASSYSPREYKRRK